MPILPGYEPRVGTIPAKVEYELAIEYQLKKIIYFSELFSKHLLNDKHPNDLEDVTYFQLDTMIASVATLTEYYFSNIIYSVIGTVLEEPLAPHFAGFINGEYEEKKKAVFKKYKLGVLTKYKEIKQDDYQLRCEGVFDKTLKFIFDGKYDLLFDINNYIKHNNRIRGFCLKIFHDPQRYHYIRFSTETSFMLKSCTLKDLIDADFNELINVDKKTYSLNGIEFKYIGNTNGVYYIENNDAVFVKTNGAAGITTNSLLKMTFDLCVDIINVIVENDRGNTTRLRMLNLFKERILTGRNNLL
ncbi:TPA: hypothetical protein R5X33_001952 [Enterobacter cloacae]|nr:hypothetical protein [Enterobacter cloacae]